MKTLGLIVLGIVIGAGAVIGFIFWAAWQKVKYMHISD